MLDLNNPVVIIAEAIYYTPTGRLYTERARLIIEALNEAGYKIVKVNENEAPNRKAGEA